MALQSAIGVVIQRLRKEQGISQEKLSFEGGIDRKYLSDIENGKRNISLDILERIAKFFCMSVSSLISQAEDVDNPPFTLKDIKAILCDRGYEDAIVLQNPDYLNAIVGVSEDGRVIYSYDKMIGWLISHEGMDEEEALDFVSYATIRSLPYAGEKAPIILNDLEI